MIESHFDEPSSFVEEILLTQRATSNLVTTATNDDYSFSDLTGSSAMNKSAAMTAETEISAKLSKNSDNKVIIEKTSLAEVERPTSHFSDDNLDLRYRGAKTGGNVLDTTEHQDHEDNQTSVSFTERNMKHDTGTATKDSITKNLSGSSSDSACCMSERVITTEPSGNTVRSRFSSSHSSQESTSTDYRRHLGPQMLCQTLVDEVRELKVLSIHCFGWASKIF